MSRPHQQDKQINAARKITELAARLSRVHLRDSKHQELELQVEALEQELKGLDAPCE